MKQQHLQLAVDASRHGQKPTPFGVVEGESPMFAAAQLTIAMEAWQGMTTHPGDEPHVHHQPSDVVILHFYRKSSLN